MSPGVRRGVLVVLAGLAVLIGTAGVAQARCVTVGADGTTYTQCDLP